MKAGWEVRPLGEVCTVVNGGTPKSNVPAYWDGDVNWLTPRDMGQMEGDYITETPRKITQDGLTNSSARTVQPHSVIMSTRAPIGHLAINETPMAFNQGCRGMVPGQHLHARYLFHFLSANTEKLNDLGTGATFKELSSSALKSFPIPLPPLEEQQRIIVVLDEAFEGLTRARTHAEANLQNARDLFTLELKQIFSVGKEGWTKGSIDALCSIRSGTTVAKEIERPSGEIPYVKVADMNLTENLDGIVTSSRFLSASDVIDRQIIPAGATIFPKRGGAILTNKKRKVLVRICADLNVMGVIPGESLDEDFLHFYFLSLDMRKIGTGSSIPQINNYDINPLMLSYPPDRSQQVAVSETLQLLKDQTVALAKTYRTKLSDIDDLRQSLLQKAFAGELT